MIKAKSAQEFMDCFMRGDDAMYRNLSVDMIDPHTVLYNKVHVLCLNEDIIEVFASIGEYDQFNKTAKLLNIPLKLVSARTFENPWGMFELKNGPFGHDILKLVAYTGES